MKEEWLLNGAVVPVDTETTVALVAEIHRLIHVVGGMALAQQDDYWDALAEKQLASIKRDMRVSLEDAAVRATHKVMVELEQEPVAWKETDEIECPVCKNKGFPWPKCGHITYLERTPPQRTWVGLTDDDIRSNTCDCVDDGTFNMKCAEDYAKAIEAKLKEKNT